MQCSKVTVEQHSNLKRVRGLRNDKGKRHRYPRIRRKPLNSSKNIQDGNLSLRKENARIIIMAHKFKGSHSMRQYWRIQKRNQCKGKRNNE